MLGLNICQCSDSKRVVLEDVDLFLFEGFGISEVPGPLRDRPGAWEVSERLPGRVWRMVQLLACRPCKKAEARHELSLCSAGEEASRFRKAPDYWLAGGYQALMEKHTPVLSIAACYKSNRALALLLAARAEPCLGGEFGGPMAT